MTRSRLLIHNCLVAALALLCATAPLPARAVAAEAGTAATAATAATPATAAATATPDSASESAQKTVRVGLFEDTYHKYNEKGELSGYGYEYLQKIAGYEGWTIEYVEADWYTCFDKLESGEIDILNGISYTDERAQDMLFSALPMAEERYFIYVDGRDADISAEDISTVDGKNVGVMVGAIPEDVLNAWEADNGLATTHVNITTAEDVLQNLDAQAMDCFVSVEEDWEEDYVSPVVYIGSSDVYFAINKDCADLKKALDGAMTRIVTDDPFYNDELYEKYFATSTAAVLTDEDRAWLADHGPIRVGYIKGDVNIAQIDASTGQLKGIINDYIAFASTCFGQDDKIDFETCGYDNMEAELAALAAGEIDMIFKVPFNTHYVEEYGLSLTNATLDIPYSAVSSPGAFDQTAQNTVAIPADNWVKKWYVESCYPSWTIVDCASAEEAEKLMRTGQVDCFLVRTGRSRTYVKDSACQVNMLGSDVSASFGVRRQDATLLSILNKTVKAMPTGYLVNALSVYDNESDTVTAAEFIRDNLGGVVAIGVVIVASFAAVLRALTQARAAQGQLAEQVSIFDTLSRNFRNVYLVNLKEGTAKVLKLEDTYNDGLLDDVAHKSFPYEPFLSQWVEMDVHPDDRAALEQALSCANLREVFSRQDEYAGNYRMLVDGREINYQFTINRVGDQGTVIAGFQNIEAIIREQLAAEKRQREKDEAARRELMTAKLDAEKANATKTDFLRRMSHDIRTPINGIRGMVQIAGHHMDDPSKLRECAEKIWRATDHLLSLVNDVLDMNKLESGTFTVRHEPFSLREVLGEVNAIVEPQAVESGVHYVSWDGADVEHDRLVGSAVYLKRILMNFINNAIKYNRAGGAIRMRGQELSCENNVAWFEFVCEDTGLGMSEEFLAHAFEPFTQEGQSEARTSYGGSGLGLTIAKSLIELLGGSLELTSKLGEGTRVAFRLPMDVDLEARVETADIDYSAVRFDGVHALLAEDNDLNAEIATFLLEQHGIQVTWVEDGRQAFDELAAWPDAYDVVFMDVMMPVMDGLAATRAIRRQLGCDLPIFAMTANAFIDDIQRSLDAGMNEHLIKPLQEKQIVCALLKHVAR